MPSQVCARLTQVCEISNRAQQVRRRHMLDCLGKDAICMWQAGLGSCPYMPPFSQSYSVIASEGHLDSMSVQDLKAVQIKHLRGWENAQLKQQGLANACASLAKKARRASHPIALELEMQVSDNERAMREVNVLVQEERHRYLKISRRLDRVAGWGEVCSVCFLAPDFSCMYMQGVP